MGHYSSVTVFPLSGLIVPLITPGHRQHTARYISDTTLTRRRWAWKSSNTSCMRNTHFVVISEDPLTSSGHVSWAPYSDTPTHCEYAPTPAPPGGGGVLWQGPQHFTALTWSVLSSYIKVRIAERSSSAGTLYSTHLPNHSLLSN